VEYEKRQHTDQQQIHEQPDKVKARIEFAIARIGMRLIFDEAEVGAGVALAAGLHQIGLGDGRLRIRRGPNLVGPVAVPATRRLNVTAERPQLRVEGVAVGRELLLVARAAYGRGLHTKIRRSGLQNGVGRMAVRAHRRLQIAGGDGFAMYAFFIVGVDFGMASPAGLGDIGLVGGALRVSVALDVMRSVAALAVGRHQESFVAQRKAMDRVHVHGIDVGQSVLLGQRRVAVAYAAGARDVERIDIGTCVVLREDRVRISMATRAGMLFTIGVHAAAQCCGLVGVAGLALHGRDVVGVRIIVDVRVAVATLQAAVDAGREDLAVYGNAVTRRVGHALIAVTNEAVGGLELLRGVCGRYQRNKKNQQTYGKQSSSVHTIEEILPQ
jgi:hypothetical protein